MTPSSRVLAFRLASTTAATAAVAGAVLLSSAPRPSREALLGFEREFIVVAQRVGTVIEFGVADVPSLKRAIGAIEDGRLSEQNLASGARAWREALLRERAAVAALSAPPGLGGAQSLFLASINQYLHVAEVLAKAGAATSPERIDALLNRAVAAGSTGDDLFDRAATLIQDRRRDLGLGENTSLPDRHMAPPADENIRVLDPEDLYGKE